MPLPYALLASLLLHGLLFLPLAAAPLAPPPRLEVRLAQPEPMPDAAPEGSTERQSEPRTELRPELALAAPRVTPAGEPAKPPAATAPATPAGTAPRPAQAFSARPATQLRFYPEAAIEQGLEGDVVLQLALDDGGRVISVEVIASSGHVLLDRAAITAAKQIGALPGNPAKTRLPVRFRLTP